MSYNRRIDKLEKKARNGIDDSSVVIKVAHYKADDDTFEQSYAVFQARLKLGFIKFNEPKKIFAGGEDIKNQYKNLTIDQARKIMENFGE